jgi:hypothetical protein
VIIILILCFIIRYLLGESYVISRAAVQRIVETALRMPLIPNEDAYITGILAKRGDVLRLNISPKRRGKAFPRAKAYKLYTGEDIWQTKVRDDKMMNVLWQAMSIGPPTT